MEQQNHQSRPPYTANDEIDLFDLVEGLIAEKVTIISIFLVAILLAGLFAFLGPQTYEAKASFQPPLQKDIITLNYPGIVETDEMLAYGKFIEVLTSPDLAVQLLGESSIKDRFLSPDGEAGNFTERLMRNINISLPTEGKQKLLTGDSLLTRLSVSWSTAEDAFFLASSIVDVASKNAKHEFLEDKTRVLDELLVVNGKQFEVANQAANEELEADISRRYEVDLEQKDVILEKIRLLREEAAQQRTFQISRLETDFELAKKLNIDRPIDPLDYRRELVTRTTIGVNNTPPSRYWLGTEILEAEIQALKSRTSDDPYIEGLSELQKELAALKTNHRINTLKARTDNLPFSETLREIKKREDVLLQALQRLQAADFKVVRVALEPVLPTSPIKPKKLIVLALGAIAGGMLGIIIALVKRAVIIRRRQQ